MEEGIPVPCPDAPEAASECAAERGFILQSTYRIERGRPVVHLFGTTESGESFVVRDTRTRPSFFVAEDDLPALKALPALARGQTGFPNIGERRWQTLSGAAVREIFTAAPSDVPPLRDILRASGITCHEADLPFTTRYLIDHGIRGALRIQGAWRTGRRVRRIYENPLLASDDLEPELRVLALDIETDPQAEHVFSFALFGRLPHRELAAEVHAVALPEHAHRPHDVESGGAAGSCFYCESEAALLRALRDRLREIDPDILTGWNVVDFDLTVLQQAFARCGIPFELGRADLPCRLRPTSEPWSTSRADVPGRAVIDGLSLLRGGFIRLDDYSLETAARTILGEGKLFTAEDRGEAIAGLYRDNLPVFLAYNLTDARLVIDILERLQLVPLAVRRSLLTGQPIDRVGGSIAAFDFLYLTALHRRSIVGPSVAAQGATHVAAQGATRSGPEETAGEDEEDAGAEHEPEAIGGYVLEGVPGIFDNVWLFDYRSLYPSIIRTFGIDPLGHIRAGEATDPAQLLEAPNGARFLRSEGILPDILGELFPQREAARRRGDLVGATAIKLLMNSLNGVLATPRCRFHSTWVSNAVTTFGQTILLWTKDRLEEMGFRVVYGDTDSVFVVSASSDAEVADARGREIVAQVNAALADWVRNRYNASSYLKLEYDRLFLKLFIPSLRHSSTGSKKRYAGLIATDGSPELVVAGLESVRRDWTVLAKDFQRRLLMKVFVGEAVDRFVAEFVRDLRAGLRDDQLVYRKALRKPIEDYGRTTPQHVKAARLMHGKHRRIVAYVMTIQGPQPLGFVTSPLDYDHYIEKQLRPIAESILVHAGTSFDEASGRGGQIGLL